jgi:NodT family efflux transporter outer membrane factor (OMF) lipoprotein
LLGLTAALSACVSLDAEDALAPVDVPVGWAATSEALSGGVPPITEDWLAELDQPQVAVLVGEALAYNNNLAASAARVNAARERAYISLSGALPQLGGSLAGTRSRSPQGTRLIDGQQVIFPGGYNNSTRLGLSLSWEIDIWGRLTDQARASFLDSRSAALDYASAELSIAGGVAQSVYGLTAATLLRELSERDVETGEANLRIIQRRFDAGVSSALDLRLARSSLAQSRATLIARQQAEEEAARRLEVLLGRYPEAEIAALDALPTLAPMFDEDGEIIGLGTPETLLFRRPDVLSAESQISSQGLRVAAARKAFLPSLSLNGGGQWDDTNVADLFDLDQVAANLTASLFQPIFQGGRLRAQAAAAKDELEATVYTYAQTVLDAYQEVENALAAERYLAAREAAQLVAFEEAVAAEELATRQYLTGTTNIFNLISAQQRRISSEAQYITAAQTRLSNRIDLYLALGAPFEAPATSRVLAGAEPPVTTPKSVTRLKGDRS